MTTQTDAERAARNVELVQAGYDAFTRGDLDAVETLFHPDVVWHAQPLGALSGDHKGWQESCASSARRWRCPRARSR